MSKDDTTLTSEQVEDIERAYDNEHDAPGTEPDMAEVIEFPRASHEVVEGEVTEVTDETPTIHTILEVWRETLAPAAEEANKKVTPQWASRMIAKWGKLEFADMNDFRDLYFTRIDNLLDILKAEIQTDKDCLTYSSYEKDAKENREHYFNVLRDWQLCFLQWELDWDCTSKSASVELAVTSELHDMFFGATGITQYLDNIKFEFTEDDQQSLANSLIEVRDAHLEGR